MKFILPHFTQELTSTQIATGLFAQSVLPEDRRRWWRGHMPLKQEQASPERPRCMGGANEHWGFKNPVMKEMMKS